MSNDWANSSWSNLRGTGAALNALICLCSGINDAMYRSCETCQQSTSKFLPMES
jgi:hypothetical protein